MKLITDFTMTSRVRSQDGPGGAANPFPPGSGGAWFDPSDQTTLIGMNGAVAAAGDPVALMLDKSAGLTQQAIALPALSLMVADNGAAITFADGRIVVADATNANNIMDAPGVIPGQGAYRLEIDVVDYVSGGIRDFVFSDSLWGVVWPVAWQEADGFGNGTNSTVFPATNAVRIRLRTQAGSRYKITAIRLFRISGSHLSQPVTAARPIHQVAEGRHWLEFDGIDDSLEGPFVPQEPALTVMAGWRRTGAGTGAGALQGIVSAYLGNGRGRNIFASGSGFGAFNRTEADAASATVTVDTLIPAPVTATFQGLAGAITVNSGEQSASALADGLGEVPDTLALGRGRAFAERAEGALYGALVFSPEGNPTAGEAWINAKLEGLS